MPELQAGAQQASTVKPHELTYTRAARVFHWVTVAFVAVLAPLGLAMHYRGTQLNIWDGTTNAMYSLHKLLGFTLLLIVVARVVYRFKHGRPDDEKNLETWQQMASYVVHSALYVMLLVVPILGWVGVQRFPALDVFGLFNLPRFLKPNEAAAARAFWLHSWAAYLLLALIALHISAALFHHFVRQDGVLKRMWPGRNDP